MAELEVKLHCEQDERVFDGLVYQTLESMKACPQLGSSMLCVRTVRGTDTCRKILSCANPVILAPFIATFVEAVRHV